MSTERTTRALAPDLARGLMLLLIVLSNTTFHLWAAPYGPTGWHPADGGALDRAAQFAMIVGLDLRVYPLFAFLFGYGLVQSLRSREPIAGRRRLYRRCLLLIVFGAAHAAFLMAGDILGAYGVLGLLLCLLLIRRSDRVLRVVAAIGAVVLAMMLASGVFGAIDLADSTQSASSVLTVELYASNEPSYLTSVVDRLSTWTLVTLLVPFSITAPVAAILGMLAARHRVLEEPGAHLARLRAVAVGGIAVGWAGGLPSALAHVGVWDAPDVTLVEFGPLFAVQSSTGLAAGLGYVAALTLLAHRLRGRRRAVAVTAVAALGRRSMSGYLTHSLLFAPVLAAWGLGLGAHLGSASMAGFAVGVWLLTVVGAYVLDRARRDGPVEVLMRRLVDGPTRASAGNQPRTL